jgi:acetylglutamate kinase
VIKEIDDQSYKVLLGENAIADGMLPKLQNAFHALSQNVSKICIGDTDMLQPGATLFTTIKL